MDKAQRLEVFHARSYLCRHVDQTSQTEWKCERRRWEIVLDCWLQLVFTWWFWRRAQSYQLLPDDTGAGRWAKGRLPGIRSLSLPWRHLRWMTSRWPWRRLWQSTDRAAPTTSARPWPIPDELNRRCGWASGKRICGRLNCRRCPAPAGGH